MRPSTRKPRSDLYRGSTVPAKPTVRMVCGATTTERTGRGAGASACCCSWQAASRRGGAQGEQGHQDRFHRAAPSANATTCWGRNNCAPAGHDDLARLEPLTHEDLSSLVAFDGDRLQRHGPGPRVDGPHGRLPASGGKRAPRDHHELAGSEPALADDGGAERHGRWRMLDADLDPDGSVGRVHGRGDLTHGALCFDGRIRHQRQLDGGIGGFVGEDRLVDVEHRVARSVLGDREDGLCRLHDLPRLGCCGP